MSTVPIEIAKDLAALCAQGKFNESRARNIGPTTS